MHRYYQPWRDARLFGVIVLVSQQALLRHWALQCAPLPNGKPMVVAAAQKLQQESKPQTGHGTRTSNSKALLPGAGILQLEQAQSNPVQGQRCAAEPPGHKARVIE